MAQEIWFFILLNNNLVLVSAGLNETLAKLFARLPARYIPPKVIWNDCKFDRLKEPVPIGEDDIDDENAVKLEGIPDDVKTACLNQANRMSVNPARTKICQLATKFLEDHIYLVIEIPDCESRGIALQVEEEVDAMADLTASFKRTITISPKSLTPSQAAKSSEYAKIQSSAHRILDCRCDASSPVNTVAPAIQLFNPAFAYFSSKALDPQYSVPDDVVRDVRDLMVQFARIYRSEEDRRHHLRGFLQKAIKYPLNEIRNADRTSPDFVVLGRVQDTSMQPHLLVVEEKMEFGAGASDPSTQAAFSFLHISSQAQNRELNCRTCCPTFIVVHAGPWLTVMGGIITANCVVQRLTDFLWLPIRYVYDDDQYYRTARVFYALRESMGRLEKWYQDAPKVAPFDFSVPTRHPRFFPTPNVYPEGSSKVQFIYQEPLERNTSCVTYLANTVEKTPRNIVVKFVTSYGADAHRLMASNGFAPELLYHGPINVSPDMPSYGKLRMVVMLYVDGMTLQDTLKKGQVPDGFKTDLRQAVQKLHDAGYVFGDLRPPNTMVTPNAKSTAQLIDFDWAGKAGEIKYPAFISESIEWPKGVQGLALIKEEHDLVMLDILLSLC